MNNILINQSELDRIANYLKSHAIETVEKDFVKPEMTKLKKISTEYISFLEENLSHLQELKEIDIHRKKLRASYRKKHITTNKGFSEQPEYETWTKKRNQIVQSIPIQKIISQTELFQKQIFLTMDKQIETIFVDEDIDSQGKVTPLLYKMEAKDLFTNNATEYGKFGAKTTAAIKTVKKELVEIKQDDKYNYDALVEAYNNYIQRRKISKRNFVMVLNQKINTIDILDKTWTVQKTGQLGDIKEAFASLYFSGRYKNMIPGQTETNIYILMKEIATVDATPGALEGDVVVGNIEYSIKSIGASYQSIYTFYEIAKVLKEDTTNNPKILKVMQEYFKKPPRNQPTSANALGNFLRSKLDKFAKDFYKELERDLTK